MLTLRRFPFATAALLGALAMAFQSPHARAAGIDATVLSRLSIGDLPVGVEAVTAVEGVYEYRLSNGLRILLVPDDSKPTTTVNMTYLVGSRHENYGETGMAHLLEHMLFKGTPTQRNALGEFSRRGLRANGSTSVDRTNYFATFAADADTLQWYLGWQADVMVNASILRSDLDTEMTVVRNEMESGENSPFRVLLQRMQAAAYEWHNYGKSTIGARADVENVDIEQLRAFYHEYYQPDNAVLIVSGQFDAARTLRDIARDFGRIPRPKRELPRLYTTEPVQDGERSVTVRRHGGTPLVATLYHTPAASSDQAVALEAAAFILGDTPSGRLYQQLVRGDKAASVFSFSLDRYDPGTVMFGAELQPGMDVSTALWGVIDAVETTRQSPFTDEELNRARSKMLLDWQQTYNDPQNLGVALSEAIAAGDWRLFFLYRDRVRDLKLEEVQQVAQSWLVRSNRTEGRYIPTEEVERAPTPEEVDLPKLLDGYQGDPDFKPVAAFDSSPANIDASTQRETLELPNGPVELALLPKPTRGERVTAQLQIQFGDVESLRGKREAASAVASLLEAGTPSLTRQQIDDAFQALDAEVGIGGDGDKVRISMSTKSEHLPALIKLVTTLLHESDFPADQVEELRRNALTSLESSRTDPTQVAAKRLARHNNPWPADDIRYVPSFEESIENVKALTRDDIVAFHDTFYGAGRVLFSAVGEFDPGAVRQALTDGLADWQPAPAWSRIPNPYRDVAPEQIVTETPDKANAFYIARQWIPLQDSDPDFVPLYLANNLLGESETSRLWMRVRETDGLSYNVRSALSASAQEPSGSWTMYAIFAPENRAKLEQGIQEEVDRVLRDGFTEAEVREGVQAMLNQRRLSRAQDGVLASAWLGYLETGRSFAWSARIDDELRALTAEQVNAAVRKYLKPGQFTSSVAGDFR